MVKGTLENESHTESRGTVAAVAAAVPQVKRLNINLPAKAFDELQELARSSGRTMTDIVRLALGLVVVGVEETERGNRLAITSSDGRLLREIVLPR
ncbi:MAG TPA: ribbon-helix-helix protein, CopG family [Thermoanaerobaculia bacterium]|nr:ribbon-helix-helix protein, CopG family [Thermoanaerobaculia bacterium]